MGVQSTEEIKAGIIELCSEDDYGSWELWWNISAQVTPAQTTALKRSFLDVVSELFFSKQSDSKVSARPAKLQQQDTIARSWRAKSILPVNLILTPTFGLELNERSLGRR